MFAIRDLINGKTRTHRLPAFRAHIVSPCLHCFWLISSYLPVVGGEEREKKFWTSRRHCLSSSLQMLSTQQVLGVAVQLISLSRYLLPPSPARIQGRSIYLHTTDGEMWPGTSWVNRMCQCASSDCKSIACFHLPLPCFC